MMFLSVIDRGEAHCEDSKKVANFGLWSLLVHFDFYEANGLGYLWLLKP